MRRASVFIGLASTLALGACAVAPPTGPSVMALPGKGKTFEAFQQDEGYCRQMASVETGGASPAQAANNSAVGSAVVGTALGAVAGAALGSVSGAAGAGAAIGGATGLLAGSAIGAGNAQDSAAGLQQRYDMTYTQCMVARGDRVESAPAPYYAGGYPAGYAAVPAYAYPPPYYYPAAPYWGSPGVSIGIGGGWGWGGGWGHDWDDHWHDRR